MFKQIVQMGALIVLFGPCLPAVGQSTNGPATNPTPTAFATGNENWIAPQGTLISIDKNSGRVSVALPTQPLDGSEEEAVRFEEWRQHSYPGDGPYPAKREEPSSLPTHTVYRPADLTKAPKLPILLWANGGCRNTSVEFTRFLGELASRGYLVIAVGRSDVPFMIVNYNGGLVAGAGGPQKKPNVPLQIVDPTYLTRALDWAITENANSSSPLHGHIDVNEVAALGQSCGGLQAFGVVNDPRIKTIVALNSFFPTPSAPDSLRPGLGAKGDSETITKPVAYFEGGPADLAYVNAQASFRALPGDTVALMVNMPSLGHTGAYPMPDIRWTRAVLSWLDWQLKDDESAKAIFAGSNCGMCTDPEIWIQSKNIK